MSMAARTSSLSAALARPWAASLGCTREERAVRLRALPLDNSSRLWSEFSRGCPRQAGPANLLFDPSRRLPGGAFFRGMLRLAAATPDR